MTYLLIGASLGAAAIAWVVLDLRRDVRKMDQYQRDLFNGPR